jgi:hypothetical protein
MALPDQSEVLEYFDRYSNWNRWGSDDELGTLNFVTAEKRVEASRLVRSGAVASCARIVDTLSEPNNEMGPPQRFVTRTVGTDLAGNQGGREAGASDYFGMIYHGVRVTHIDALSHVFWDDTAYNGIPADVVAVPDGARKLDVTRAKQGVFTRGLLVDAARFRGVDWMEAQQSVSGDEVRQSSPQRGSSCCRATLSCCAPGTARSSPHKDLTIWPGMARPAGTRRVCRSFMRSPSR